MEEVLVDAEEDLENAKNESEQSKAKLHNIIDTLESKMKLFQNENQVKVSELEDMLHAKKREIQHLGDKINELETVVNDKEKMLDQFKQDQVKQEKEKVKKIKKESQKAKKIEKNLQESKHNVVMNDPFEVEITIL